MDPFVSSGMLFGAGVVWSQDSWGSIRSRETQLIDDSKLTADCDNCLGLCCVAHYFSVGKEYSINKPQYVPCSNLDSNYRCSIHEKLDENGMSGCRLFNCWGAGQRACRRVLNKKNWQKIPGTAQNLFEIYFKLREIHKLIRPLMDMLNSCSDPVLAEKIKSNIDEVAEIRTVTRGTERITHWLRVEVIPLAGLWKPWYR